MNLANLFFRTSFIPPFAITSRGNRQVLTHQEPRQGGKTGRTSLYETETLRRGPQGCLRTRGFVRLGTYAQKIIASSIGVVYVAEMQAMAVVAASRLAGWQWRWVCLRRFPASAASFELRYDEQCTLNAAQFDPERCEGIQSTTEAVLWPH